MLHVHILLRAPLGVHDMTQSGADKHQGTLSIREGTNDACPATNLPIEAFYGVVGTDLLPVFFRKVHVRQGSGNAV